MNYRRPTVLSVVIFLMAVGQVAAKSESPLFPLGARVWEARAKIRKAIVRATIHTEWPSRPETIRHYIWYLDNGDLRSDVRQVLHRQWADGSESDKESTLRIVFRKEQCLLYDDTQTPGANGVAAYQLDPSTKEGEFTLAGWIPYKVDPRSVGLIPRPHALWGRMDSTSFLRPDGESQVQVTADNRDGMKVTKVEFSRRGNAATLWIDESRGPSVIAAVSELRSSGGASRYSLSSKIGKFGEFWYPTELVLECTKSGDLVQRSRIKIESAVFNEELPLDTFTFGGMRVPPGNLVLAVPNVSNTSRHWDGKQLVGITRELKSTPSQPTSSASSFLFLGINLLVIGVLVGLIAISRKGKQGSLQE